MDLQVLTSLTLHLTSSQPRITWLETSPPWKPQTSHQYRYRSIDKRTRR